VKRSAAIEVEWLLSEQDFNTTPTVQILLSAIAPLKMTFAKAGYACCYNSLGGFASKLFERLIFDILSTDKVKICN